MSAFAVVQSRCAIVWNMTKDYPNSLRGDQCTSCDAAGYPIAPLLFTPEEVVHDKLIDHAIRYCLFEGMQFVLNNYLWRCSLSYPLQGSFFPIIGWSVVMFIQPPTEQMLPLLQQTPTLHTTECASGSSPALMSLSLMLVARSLPEPFRNMVSFPSPPLDSYMVVFLL